MKSREVLAELQAARIEGDLPRYLPKIESSGVRVHTLRVAIKRVQAMKSARHPLAVLATQLHRRAELATMLRLERDSQRTRAWHWAALFVSQPEHRKSDEDRATHARLAKRYRLFTSEGS